MTREDMKPKVDHKQQKIEVKLGPRSVIVEQCQLNDLMEALTEMKTLASNGKALINLGSA